MECIFSGFQNSNMYTVQFPSSSAILYANSEGRECKNFWNGSFLLPRI